MKLRDAIKSARDSSRNGFVGFVERCDDGEWRPFGYVADTFRRVHRETMHRIGPNESVASVVRRITPAPAGE